MSQTPGPHPMAGMNAFAPPEIATLEEACGVASEVGYGITGWLAGLGSSLGLILVVGAGEKLFTGNDLIVMREGSGRWSVTLRPKQGSP